MCRACLNHFVIACFRKDSADLIGKNRLATVICLACLFIAFIANPSAAQQALIFAKLQERYFVLVTTLLRTEPPELPRYFVELKKNFEIDSSLFLSILSRPLSSQNVRIENAGFTDQELKSQDYIPFKIGAGRVTISTRITEAPESQFYFYMTFMKVYSGLNPGLQ